MRLAITIFLWIAAAVCLFTIIVVICDLVTASRERKARIAREKAAEEKAEREARRIRPKPLAPMPAPPPSHPSSVVVLPPIVPPMPAMSWSPPMAPPASAAANTGQPSTGTPNDVSNNIRR